MPQFFRVELGDNGAAVVEAADMDGAIEEYCRLQGVTSWDSPLVAISVLPCDAAGNILANQEIHADI